MVLPLDSQKDAGHMGKAKENIQTRLNKRSWDRQAGEGLEAWAGPQLLRVLAV